MTMLILLALGLSRPPAPQVIGPRVSEKPVVTYRFRARGAHARFRCAVDRAPFRRCRSPYRVRLGFGLHTLRVREGRTGLASTVRIRILEPRAPEVRVGGPRSTRSRSGRTSGPRTTRMDPPRSSTRRRGG